MWSHTQAPSPAAASPQSPRCRSARPQPASQCRLTWKTCDAMSSITWPAARTLAVNLVLPQSVSPCVFCVLRNPEANRGLRYLLKPFHVRHAGGGHGEGFWVKQTELQKLFCDPGHLHLQPLRPSAFLMRFLGVRLQKEASKSLPEFCAGWDNGPFRRGRLPLSGCPVSGAPLYPSLLNLISGVVFISMLCVQVD